MKARFTAPFALYITRDQFSKVNRYANRYGLTRSAVCRQILTAYFKAQAPITPVSARGPRRTINIRVSDRVLRQLEESAEAREVTGADIGRMAVAWFFENH